jgi:hypothetical protein
MQAVVIAPISAGDPPLRILIDRHGWTDATRPVYHYEVVYDGHTVLAGDDLRGPATGATPTLRAVAASLAGFLSAAGESLAARGDASDYWHEYDPTQREFLAATHERFATLCGP